MRIPDDENWQMHAAVNWGCTILVVLVVTGVVKWVDLGLRV